MVLLDDLEVDVQYSKRPFEEQERSFLDNETTSPQDYEWFLLRLTLRRLRVYKSTRLRVAVAWATLLLRGLTTKDKGQKSKRYRVYRKYRRV